MARLDVVYNTSRDAAQTALRYQVYFDALRELTVFELKMAVDAWLKSEERFAPSPGQLLALARPAWLRDHPTPKRHQHQDEGPPVPPIPAERIKQIYAEAGFNISQPASEDTPAMKPWTEDELTAWKEAGGPQRLLDALAGRIGNRLG